MRFLTLLAALAFASTASAADLGSTLPMPTPVAGSFQAAPVCSCDSGSCKCEPKTCPTNCPVASDLTEADLAGTVAAPVRVCGPNGCSLVAASTSGVAFPTDQVTAGTAQAARTGPIRRILGKLFHRKAAARSGCCG